MSQYKVETPCDTDTKTFDDKETAIEGKDTHEALCGVCETGSLNVEQVEPDGGSVEAEVIDNPPSDEPVAPEPATEELPANELAKDPIEWLKNANPDFVNRIKGTPAISKQGFRFIQSRFGITTESEVVQWVDDPTGCIVWARAELPSGQAAEAHGEGYITESDVDDNEFARYADTRAKNRAISDLTSAGALAVSELNDNNE